MPFIHFHSRPSGSTLAAANQSPAVAPCRSHCHPAPRALSSPPAVRCGRPRDVLDSRHGVPHVTVPWSPSSSPPAPTPRLIPSHSPPGLPHAKTNNQNRGQINSIPRMRIQNYPAKSRGLSLNRRSLNPARKVVTERTRRSNPRGIASCARPHTPGRRLVGAASFFPPPLRRRLARAPPLAPARGEVSTGLGPLPLPPPPLLGWAASASPVGARARGRFGAGTREGKPRNEVSRWGSGLCEPVEARIGAPCKAAVTAATLR